MRTALFLMLGLILSLAGCANKPAPEPTPDDHTSLGPYVFSNWCAPCHGANGEGFINALDAPALNADGESYLLTDDEILHAIIDGGAESGGAMAPLGDSLTEAEEAAVLDYVHFLWSDEQRAAHEDAGSHALQE